MPDLNGIDKQVQKLQEIPDLKKNIHSLVITFKVISLN